MSNTISEVRPRSTYDIRSDLVKLNEGSRLEIVGNEWILYVKSKKINFNENDCTLLGDTIFDSDVEMKICRLVKDW